ncbi:MAG: hypothetical protein KA715_00200 [Xanthomonadaceae bacterium]|nr:hypothetical protein [Xanthomonadaceae bacterium]
MIKSNQSNKNLNRISRFALVKFIWKWKVVTSSMIGLHFYKTAFGQAHYKKIQLLKKSKLIRDVVDPDSLRYFYSVTKDGFLLIKGSLPAIIADGFKSESIIHDAESSAIQYWMGCFLCRSQEQIITEQEIRHCDSSKLHPLLPKTKDHRPDGYFVFDENQNEVSLIAFEYDRSRKPKELFGPVNYFYENYPAIKKVIWVTDSRSNAVRLHDELKKSSEHSFTKHVFFILEEFLKKGFESRSFDGRLLLKDLLKSTGNTLEIDRKSISLNQLLSPEKAPFRQLLKNFRLQNKNVMTPHIHT